MIDLYRVLLRSELLRAFEPLLNIERTEGEWTLVTSNSNKFKLEGKKFFCDILKLQTLLEQCKTPSDISTSNKTFDILRECTHFIYPVRNNIFHGSKTLGEVSEPKQKQRIEVYDLFLKGLTSMFFLAVGKDTAACDFVPCPIFSSSLPTLTETTIEVIDQSLILRATANRMMKDGDSRLVARFTKIAPPLHMRQLKKKPLNIRK